MANFGDIFNALKDGAIALAESTVKNYVDEAKKDGIDFLNSTKDKLERWTAQLADGKLKTDEFEWLVDSQKDLAVMKALKDAGLAQIRVDQFRGALMNMIVDTIFHIIKP